MKILISLIALFVCSHAEIKSALSILPEQTFVKKIGGEKVSTILMVLPGNSPHTYEPKAKQLKALSDASLYFSIGVEFEKIWLDKFINIHPEMKIINVAQNIRKRDITTSKKEPREESEHMDPHIWTSPSNVKVIAKNIYEALIEADSSNKEYYQKNYRAFLDEIIKTDEEIKSILSHTTKGKKFMVFHPSWGYFANEYGLEQLTVEIEGKSPKPKELISLIDDARKNNITSIFVQPEFSDSAARVIAKELNIDVVKISPLNADWSQNLIKIAKAIAGKA